MRLVTDMIEFGAQHVPHLNTISISGYHIREAGSTAVQELAFTLRDGIEYVRVGARARPRRRRVRAAPVASSSTRTTISSRRSPSTARRAGSGRRCMRDRFGAKDERSWMLRFHTQTAGCSLTAQQPDNNIVRTASRRWRPCWAARSRCTRTSMDEAALPSEHAVTLALRTQQVIAHETRRREHASIRSAAATSSRR